MVSGLKSHCRGQERRTDRQCDYIRVISCPRSARTIRVMLCKKLNAIHNMPQPWNTLFFREFRENLRVSSEVHWIFALIQAFSL